jgi:hypothetical protein
VVEDGSGRVATVRTFEFLCAKTLKRVWLEQLPQLQRGRCFLHGELHVGESNAQRAAVHVQFLAHPVDGTLSGFTGGPGDNVFPIAKLDDDGQIT